MVASQLRAMLERHVQLFNDAMSSGDYAVYLDTFADDAQVRFEFTPVGPFSGRSEIAAAYAARPVRDTIALIGIEEMGADAILACFEWDDGGTGRMFLRWDGDMVVELTLQRAD